MTALHKLPNSIGTNQKTPWYSTQCSIDAYKEFGLSAAIDGLGLIPEAGGFARLLGNQVGFRGVVADQFGARQIKAFGGALGFKNLAYGLSDGSGLGVASTALGIVGFADAGFKLSGYVPFLGQGVAALSLGVDTLRLANALNVCRAAHANG